MKKNFFALVAIMISMVATVFVSCGSDDDEIESGEVKTPVEWIVPYLNWGAARSDVMNYMDAQGWSSMASSSSNSVVYTDKKRQTVVYMLTLSSSLTSLTYQVSSSNESEFSSLQSFLESKLGFKSEKSVDDSNDLIYTGFFKYNGVDDAVLLSYNRSLKQIVVTMMKKPVD